MMLVVARSLTFTPRPMRARIIPLFLVLTLSACASVSARSSGSSTATRAAVMAVVDSALLHINSGDLIALSDLMIPEAMVFPAQDQAGRGGSYTVRTVASQRATGKRAPIIERGYDPIVRLSGTIASVWMPYDLWAGGKWSHCGIDLLTLVQVGSAWRIANFTYTIEQPPACAMHPDGPPPGYTPPPRR
jgi:hypothetical protein